MTLTSTEQLFLELVNRARLDPAAEAIRQGVALTAGLSPGQISADSKQVLAPNTELELAATRHSLWMLQNDTFSHTGANGETMKDRITAAHYQLEGGWRIAENLTMIGNTAPVDLASAVTRHFANLWASSGHRINTLNPALRETGIGQESGIYTQNGLNFHASMLTQKFATSGQSVMITGVAINDLDGDQFYDIGEGIANVAISGAGKSTVTGAAGGYGLAYGTGQTVALSLRHGAISIAATVTLTDFNVKLDLLGDGTMLTSGHVQMGTGGTNLVALGLSGLSLGGNTKANRITGTAGNDTLDGGTGGTDVLLGGAGNDTYVVRHKNVTIVETDMGGHDTVLSAINLTLGKNLESLTLIGTATHGTGNRLSNVITGNDLANVLRGGEGHDTLYGGLGNDLLRGGPGNDLLYGGAGDDTLNGGFGTNQLAGGAGNDTYRLNSRHDSVFEEADGGFDLVISPLSYTLAEHFEALRLTGTAEWGAGNAANNLLTGSARANRLHGLDGDDTLKGAGGNDALYGGNGNDRLFGDKGNDTLDGGAGDDILTGGAGADVFVLRRGGGHDRVSDFNLAQGDRLWLDRGLAANGLTIQQMLDQHAVVSSGRILLDFGEDSLLLTGIKDLAALAGQIDLI